MVHAIITLIYCYLILYFDLPLYFYPFMASFYVGREIAQAEYRYIEHCCNRKRALFHWYDIFKLDAWTIKGLLDWMLPVAAAVALYFIY